MPTPDQSQVKNKAAVEDQRNRYERIAEQGRTPQFPELDVLTYIAHYWSRVGHCSSNGMGMVPLKDAEIMHWAQALGLKLSPFEHEAIKAMSCAYVSQYSKATKPECPPPFGHYFDHFDRAAVSNKIDNLFGRLAKRK